MRFWTGTMQERWNKIQKTLQEALQKRGTPAERIILVGATKGVTPEKIRQAYALGLRVVGENRIQEALPKMEALKDLDLSWHFIGHLQKNKAHLAVKHFSLIQSVDSLRLAQHLEKVAQAEEKVIPVFVEVNIGKELTKYGVMPEEVEALCEKISEMDHLRLQGLMTLPPYHPDPEKVRPFFHKMRKLFEKLQASFSTLEHLSMGMSEDYPVAIEEGATMIRLGRALFGERL